MSYSDRDSNYGVLGGIGGTILLVLLVGVRITLRSMARSSRNHNYSESQYDNNTSRFGTNLPETNRERSRLVSPNMSYEQQQAEAAQRQAEAAQRQADAKAAYEERLRQEAEKREADRLQREQANADQRAQFEQQQADARARREQQQAEQQARDEERRNQLANAFNNRPAPFVPPVQPAAAPVADAVAPAQPAALDQTPGFAPTEMSQVKLRESVFVSSEGQWYPALVQAKRGLIIQVRYKSNGNVDSVTLDRVRLEKEPVAKATGGLPAALRAVGSGPKPKTSDEEDDSLYVAKPVKEGGPVPAPATAASPMGAAPAAPAVAKANPAEFRTWTNDTGEFKVEAVLVGFEFDLVQLKRRDGKVLSLPILKLSAPDQAIVRGTYQ